MVPTFIKNILGPAYTPIRRVVNRAVKRPWSQERAHKYWTNPDVVNNPRSYVSGEERSAFLGTIILKHVPRESSILEVGCNVGRNLNCLLQLGYKNLTGIEINSAALKLGAEIFPKLYEAASFVNSSVEDVIDTMRKFDVIYSMAVLMHLPPESDWVLRSLGASARSVLITIENEVMTGGRTYLRNYHEFFKPLGWKQSEELPCNEISGLGSDYVARVFKR